ncbi:MAG TPA: metallophosphoesterase family protein [Candidatus Binatia bacterium]|nr:metallophosphoesterase family protein [Candidatus Binatia bacterium]
MKIGVISDTHGFLDPQVERIFAGVNHILHAGDIGYAAIILELEFIAPVTAVLGNTDSDMHLPLTRTVELARRKFLVHHIINPRELPEPMAARIAKEKPDAVVFGHTHKQFAETINDVFFFNPGYAGKLKFGVERSVAILHCDETGIRHEFIPL